MIILSYRYECDKCGSEYRPEQRYTMKFRDVLAHPEPPKALLRNMELCESCVEKLEEGNPL